MPKLSITPTLVEAFWLGWSRRQLILWLAIFGAIPTTLMTAVSLAITPPAQPPPHLDPAQATAYAAQTMTSVVSMGACALLFMAIGLVVTAMTTASLLGVLKTEPSPADLWPTIKANIRSYTWTFIIVSILLTIVACVLMIPFTILISIFGLTTISPGSKDPLAHSYFIEFLVMLMAVVYLVFVKYALANPVIVLEGKRPLAALARSWQMTRGFFWYVLGSYVFLGTAEYGIDCLFQYFETPTSFTLAKAAELLFDSVLQLYWLLLAWCMYHRIKAAEPTASPV